jgi:glutathione S-transferase
MKIHGDIHSGNCLKVKYTADLLGLKYEWVAVDVTTGRQLLKLATTKVNLCKDSRS